MKLEFEASVVKDEDRYGQEKGKKYVQLQCLNGREVMRDLMRGYLLQLPKGMPQYYGRLSIEALSSI